MIRLFFTLLWALGAQLLSAQQVPDTSFNYPIAEARYKSGEGPVVYLDAAHHNFHTLDGRYSTFGKVLSQDGYQVMSAEKPFSKAVLEGCRVLVISNPLHESNDNGNWRLPTPSAFSPEEIATVKSWVEAGGSLFLIADHMPFGGAAQELAAVFGIEWGNNFAMDNRRRNYERFYRSNGSLAASPITDGSNAAEKIDTIVTFTGSAFKIPDGATPILSLDEHYTLLSPEVAWEFEENTPHQNGAGWRQIAYMPFGEGKVVVSGEAAMFSAQLGGPNQFPVGMNDPVARQNPQLLLNILHWLTE